MPRAATDMLNRDQTFGASYAVELPAFQGPVQLLLHLIEREELDINEISLMAVTDQYLRAIAQLDELEPDALAGFIDVASRLLYIKSNRLLPRPGSEEEEEEDAGEALIRHLLEYRQFKQAANSLKDRVEAGQRAFARVAPAPQSQARTPRPPDLSGVDLPSLQAALKRALERIPVEKPAPRLQPYAITVAEQIERVRSRVRMAAERGAAHARSPIAFSTLLGEGCSRIEVIVTFLAVLELIKLRELSVRQSGTFGEIILLPAGKPPDAGGVADEEP
ncbi:MAG: segregation/condensation protein A [Chloroflexota bacterium]|nr:segregation/condensation protein A [Chloroflexota bacterium]